LKHQPAPIASGAQHQAVEAEGSEAGSRGRGGVKPWEGKPNGKGVRGGKQQGLTSPVKSPSGPPFPGRGFPLRPKRPHGLSFVLPSTCFRMTLESKRGFAALHVLARPVNLYVLKK